MNQCPNCGQVNNYGVNFCRFCGANLTQTQKVDDYPASPPPYIWKTDEYQVKNQPARQTQQIENVQQMIPPHAMNPPNHPQPLTHPNNAQFMAGYRCPRCGTQNLPYITRQISTAGWVTFSVLLVTTLIFFWIGLLLKEDVRVCSVCGLRTSYF